MSWVGQWCFLCLIVGHICVFGHRSLWYSLIVVCSGPRYEIFRRWWCLWKHETWYGQSPFILRCICTYYHQLTLGVTWKFIAVRQCFSCGNLMPYFSGISGNGTLFFSWASSNRNCNERKFMRTPISFPCYSLADPIDLLLAVVER